KRYISGARHARHVTLGFRILLRPLGGIFLLLRQRRRLIRNLLAISDNALSGGNRADSAKLPERPGLRGMILKIPVRCAEGLPDSSQVRLAIRGGRTRYRRLAECR